MFVVVVSCLLALSSVLVCRAAMTFQQCTTAIDACATPGPNQTIVDQKFEPKWCDAQRSAYCLAVCGQVLPYSDCMNVLKADCDIPAYPTLRMNKFQPLKDICTSTEAKCTGCCVQGAAAVAVPRPPPTCSELATFCLAEQGKMSALGCGGCRAVSYLPLCLRSISTCVSDANHATLIASADNICRNLASSCGAACCPQQVPVTTICGANVTVVQGTTPAVVGATSVGGTTPAVGTTAVEPPSGTSSTAANPAITTSGSSKLGVFSVVLLHFSLVACW
jgi:hypothetical protein